MLALHKAGFTILYSVCIVLLVSGANCANFETTPPFYGQKYANISFPRGLLVDETGNLLVLSQGSSGVIAVIETPNSNGTVAVNQTLIADGTGLGLNHGLAYNQGFLYASSDTTVYRWPYLPGQQTIIEDPPQPVVRSIPGGGHFTRTLAFNSRGILYVSVGSDANVDPDSSRARIRTFNMNQPIPDGGIDFNFGGIFADGLRNEVGLAFDLNGVLWGVENGPGNLSREDLGGNIHNGNPAEELHKFNMPVGTHYGYPYCFTSYNLEGYEAGTQFAMPHFMDDGIHTDAWCRDTRNNEPPALAMASHEAPLGIQFYDGTGCDQVEGAFPCSATGDAFIAYHGSYSAQPPSGYRVGWLKFDKNSFEPTGENIDVIYEPNLQDCPSSDCFRPVNAVFNKNGHLFVSVDESGELFKVTYGSPPLPIQT